MTNPIATPLSAAAAVPGASRHGGVAAVSATTAAGRTVARDFRQALHAAALGPQDAADPGVDPALAGRADRAGPAGRDDDTALPADAGAATAAVPPVPTPPVTPGLELAALMAGHVAAPQAESAPARSAGQAPDAPGAGDALAAPGAAGRRFGAAAVQRDGGFAPGAPDAAAGRPAGSPPGNLPAPGPAGWSAAAGPEADTPGLPTAAPAVPNPPGGPTGSTAAGAAAVAAPAAQPAPDARETAPAPAQVQIRAQAPAQAMQMAQTVQVAPAENTTRTAPATVLRSEFIPTAADADGAPRLLRAAQAGAAEAAARNPAPAGQAAQRGEEGGMAPSGARLFAAGAEPATPAFAAASAQPPGATPAQAPAGPPARAAAAPAGTARAARAATAAGTPAPGETRDARTAGAAAAAAAASAGIGQPGAGGVAPGTHTPGSTPAGGRVVPGAATARTAAEGTEPSQPPAAAGGAAQEAGPQEPAQAPVTAQPVLVPPSAAATAAAPARVGGPAAPGAGRAGIDASQARAAVEHGVRAASGLGRDGGTERAGTGTDMPAPVAVMPSADAPSAATAFPPLAGQPPAVAQPGAPAAAAGPAATPVPPFQAQLAAALASPGFAPALGTQLRMLVREGIGQARLELNPVEMGPVSVSIELDGRRAHVEFGADSAATRAALQDSLPTLAAALRDSGFTLSGGGVSERQAGNGQGGDAPGGRPGAAPAVPGGAPDGAAAAPAAPAPTAGGRRGVVDLYA